MGANMKYSIIRSLSETKLNLCAFGFILIYAVYCFIGNNPRLINESALLEMPDYPILVYLIVSMSILVFTIIGIVKNTWTSKECGFSLGKKFLSILILGILFLIWTIIEYKQTIAIESLFQLLPIFVFVTASSLILRVLLINRFDSVFKTVPWISELAFIVSGVLFVFVIVPIPEITGSFVVFSCLLSYIYRYSKSIIVVFSDMAFFTDTQYVLLIALMVLVFYFSLALLGKHLNLKTAHKQSA